jgi:MFS family permease
VSNIQHPNTNIKPIIAIALITAVSLFGDSMLYVILPIYWQEIGLNSLVEVGILLAANRFVRLPLNPLIGWLYKKISFRTGLLIAILIAGTTTWLYGYVHEFYIWLILRCVWGLAWSLIRLGSFFMILDLSNEGNRGRFMGTYNGIYRIGSLVGMLAGSICVQWFGLKMVAAVFGIAAFLIVPVVVMFVPKAKTSIRAESVDMKKRAVLKVPVLRWTLLTAFLVFMCFEGMLTATLSHLIDEHQIAAAVVSNSAIGAATIAGALQAARILVSFFASPWIGRISDGRVGRTPLLVGSLLLSAIFMALINLSLPFPLWLLNLFSALLVASILTTLLDAFVSDLTTAANRAATMTLYVIAIDLGAAFGPVIGYLLAQYFGLPMTYWLSTAILLVISTSWFIATSINKSNINKSTMNERL